MTIMYNNNTWNISTALGSWCCATTCWSQAFQRIGGFVTDTFWKSGSQKCGRWRWREIWCFPSEVQMENSPTVKWWHFWLPLLVLLVFLLATFDVVGHHGVFVGFAPRSCRTHSLQLSIGPGRKHIFCIVHSSKATICAESLFWFVAVNSIFNRPSFVSGVASGICSLQAGEQFSEGAWVGVMGICADTFATRISR